MSNPHMTFEVAQLALGLLKAAFEMWKWMKRTKSRKRRQVLGKHTRASSLHMRNHPRARVRI